MPDQALAKFTATYIGDAEFLDPMQLHSLSGDAGFRRYYRTSSAPPYIAVDAPPSKENNLAYVRTSLLLKSLGVRVPRINAVDFHQGKLLLEDLGTSLLWDQVNKSRAKGAQSGGADSDKLYQQAVDQLLLIQSCESRPEEIPVYDDALLLAEMALFREWFITALLGMELDKTRSNKLTEFVATLSQEASSQPKVLVHRDYHARNLMCLDNGELAVIDFQDAVWGPITYDLVSLARDCYLRWSPQRLERFVNNFADNLVEQGKLSQVQRPQFRRWFDLMGLQRHIKVLGIFARLYLRDGKPGYLNDLPLVLRYTLEVMEQFEEFTEILDWMKAEVIPLCEKQPWYVDWQTAGAETELF